MYCSKVHVYNLMYLVYFKHYLNYDPIKQKGHTIPYMNIVKYAILNIINI